MANQVNVGERVWVQNSFTRPGSTVLAKVTAVNTPYCKVEFTFQHKSRKQTCRIEEVKKA